MRKRHVPHVEGNFATFVYIEVKKSRRLEALSGDCCNVLSHFTQSTNTVFSNIPSAKPNVAAVINKTLSLQNKFYNKEENRKRLCTSPASSVSGNSLCGSKSTPDIVVNTAPMDYGDDENSIGPHISLSQTVVLRDHFIESFLKKMRNSLDILPCFDIFLRTDRVDCYSNTSYDTFFAALTVSTKYDALKIQTVSTKVNEVIYSFLPRYCNTPADPSLILENEYNHHVSLAWTTQQIKAQLDAAVDSFIEHKKSSSQSTSVNDLTSTRALCGGTNTRLLDGLRRTSHWWPYTNEAIKHLVNSSCETIQLDDRDRLDKGENIIQTITKPFSYSVDLSCYEDSNTCPIYKDDMSTVTAIKLRVKTICVKIGKTIERIHLKIIPDDSMDDDISSSSSDI